MWEIIAIIVVVLFCSYMMYRYNFDTKSILLYNMYIIMMLALQIIVNYIYFVICAIIIAVLLYFKLTKRSL